METKIKSLVKNSQSKEPQRVLSVLNLTTDFLPSQKPKFTKFPVLNPRKYRSLDGISTSPRMWVPHYREHYKLALGHKKKEKKRPIEGNSFQRD